MIKNISSEQLGQKGTNLANSFEHLLLLLPLLLLLMLLLLLLLKNKQKTFECKLQKSLDGAQIVLTKNVYKLLKIQITETTIGEKLTQRQLIYQKHINNNSK